MRKNNWSQPQGQKCTGRKRGYFLKLVKEPMILCKDSIEQPLKLILKRPNTQRFSLLGSIDAMSLWFTCPVFASRFLSMRFWVCWVLELRLPRPMQKCFWQKSSLTFPTWERQKTCWKEIKDLLFLVLVKFSHRFFSSHPGLGNQLVHCFVHLIGVISIAVTWICESHPNASLWSF